MIIKPHRGWEDVDQSNPDPSQLLRSGLYPMIAIVALSSFTRIPYYTDYTWVDATQSAVINAVTYFATYFIAQFVLSLKLEKNQTADSTGDDENNRRIAIFTALNVGILMLITLVSNLMPFDLSLLQYLPLYTAFVIWKGAPYLRVETDRIGHFMILAVCSIIAPVYALGYFFHLFI